METSWRQAQVKKEIEIDFSFNRGPLKEGQKMEIGVNDRIRPTLKRVDEKVGEASLRHFIESLSPTRAGSRIVFDGD